MSRKRITDHILSNVETKRRFDDRASAIDNELDAAFDCIDWQRRNKASASLLEFIKTYCLGLMVDSPPSPKFCDALREMENALS